MQKSLSSTSLSSLSSSSSPERLKLSLLLSLFDVRHWTREGKMKEGSTKAAAGIGESSLVVVVVLLFEYSLHQIGFQTVHGQTFRG